MKKRISALLLSCALCGSMIAPAFAADGDTSLVNNNGTLTLSGSSGGFADGTAYVPVMRQDKDGSVELIGTVKVPVSGGKFDGVVDPDGKDTDNYKYGVVVGGQTYWEEPASKPDPDPDPDPSTNPRPGRPVIDDDDDDDDDDSSSSSISGGGGAGGASSKYIKNESRGNQTITPVTTPSDEWTSTTNIPQFTDVASTDWFYNAVQFVGQNGMMAGSNGRFSPYDKLTRGMMAQILYNMEGAPGGTAASFPDVNASDWFANAATWSASCGYMSGYSNGSFGPLDPITREQLASILYRYASAKGYDVTASSELNFTDGGTTSSWAVPAMKWAVGAGVLSGKTGVGGSRLDPLGNATRAEVAQILMNFSQKIVR